MEKSESPTAAPAEEATLPASADIHPDRIVAPPVDYHAPENHRFRKRYRQLSEKEGALCDAIKDKANELADLIENGLSNFSKNRALAMEHLEDCVMRAVRSVTE